METGRKQEGVWERRVGFYLSMLAWDVGKEDGRLEVELENDLLSG